MRRGTRYALGPPASRRTGLGPSPVLALAAVLLAMICALAGSAFADASAPDPGVGLPGQISGQVTDAQGDPIPNIVASLNGGVGVTRVGVTGVDGRYTITGLAAGDYWLQFGNYVDPADDTGYVSLFYGQTSPSDPFGPVHVDAGATLTGIDIVLHPGGAISGTVTDAAGTPVAGVDVALDGAGENALTDASGRYTLTNVEPGSYPLYFQPSEDSDLLHQNYGGTPVPRADFDSIPYQSTGYTPVQVTAGTTTGGIDTQLTTGGVITGTVTDNAGQPLAGITVNLATPASGPAFEWLYEAGSVTTDAAGHYRINRLAAGTYRVSFVGNGYDGQLYGGGQSYAAATPIEVAAGATVAGIDAEMRVTGAISGYVADLQGSPLAALVTAYGLDGATAGMSLTDSAGNYTIANLSPGPYLVAFSGFDAAWPTFDSQTPSGVARVVTVVGGQTTSGVDGRRPDPPAAPALVPASSSRLDQFHGTLAVSSAGTVAVAVRCTGPAACAGTATLSAGAPLASAERSRVLIRRTTIGAKRFRVAANRSAPVVVPLTPAGRSMLRRGHGHLTARLTVAGRSGASAQVVVARLRSRA
jgi:hypothetical protein